MRGSTAAEVRVLAPSKAETTIHRPASMPCIATRSGDEHVIHQRLTFEIASSRP